MLGCRHRVLSRLLGDPRGGRYACPESMSRRRRTVYPPRRSGSMLRACPSLDPQIVQRRGGGNGAMANTTERTGVGAKLVPEMMRAVVAHGPRDYRLEEVRVPQPGPGEVLVEVEACGVCASDVKCYEGAEMFWGGGGQPRTVQPPVVPGHEFIARVVALGEGAAQRHGVRVGARVVAEQIVPCGGCRYCRGGQYWMCEVHDIYGFRRTVDGGMAEYMKFPANSLVYGVPEELPTELAVLIEPLSCSIHAVERARIAFGDVVVVSGAGPLGLGMVGAARLKSPGMLIALDLVDSRLEVARRVGADLVLNPADEDVVAKVRALTGGYGCDVYIEAASHPSSVVQGLSMIRKLGRFVEFSVFGEPTTVDWSVIGDRKELDIYGAHLGPHAYPLAIEFLRTRKIDLEGVVTHKLPLEEFERGIELVASGTESIKVILEP